MRLAINGYGRVGRCLLRAWHEREDTQSLSMVAINELASHDAIAYLTQYDSTHGRFPADVSCAVNHGGSYADNATEQQLLIDEAGINEIAIICYNKPINRNCRGRRWILI